MIRTWLWRGFWIVVVFAVLSYIAKHPTSTGTGAATIGHKVIALVSGGLSAGVTFVTSLFA